MNDKAEPGWTPPCPPQGVHHYVFHVYAIDKHLDDVPMDRGNLLQAIDGHVLAEGKLIGTYEKHK